MSTYGGGDLNIQTAIRCHFEMIDTLKQAKLGFEAILKQEYLSSDPEMWHGVVFTLDRINATLMKAEER